MENNGAINVGSEREYKSLKDLMYNTAFGRTLILISVGAGLFTGYQIIEQYLTSKPEPIVQQQVLGGDKPDIYIERNGIKYYSHVDGKEISDLFK